MSRDFLPDRGLVGRGLGLTSGERWRIIFSLPSRAKEFAIHNRYSWAAALLLAATTVRPAPAQAPSQTETGVSPRTVLSGLFGTVTVDGAQWQRMVLRPRLAFGRFEAAFDVELFIDERGRFRDRGWNFDSRTAGFESVLRKIHYLQYGDLDRQEDRVYVRVGALENVTLGYGLILSDYRNTLEEPGVKKTGIDVSIQGMSPWNAGLRLLVNDALDLSRGGALIGGRLSARPILYPDESGVGRLEVGFTFVADTDQYEGLRSLRLPSRPPGDAVGMAGFDASYPIWDRGYSRLTLYGQYARLVDRNGVQGEGFGAPGLQFVLGPLRARAEYRRFSGQFRPQYFDDLYEKTRARYDEARRTAFTKASTLTDTSMRGVYGDARLSLGPLLTAAAAYQRLSGQGDATSQRFIARAALAPALLRRVPYLSQASAYYEKYNIDTRQAGFFKSTLDTFYGYLLAIDISQDVAVVWDTRYTFSPNAGTGLRRNKVLNIQAVAHF